MRSVACDRRLGGSQGGLIVARVESCEHLAGLDDVVVVNRHRGDLTGDARCNRGVMDHHIRIVGPHVRAWPENDVQDPCDADRHDETDQNERPARQRGGKPIAVLDLPVLRRSNLLLRLIVVLARRGRVRLFVWLRLGGSPLEFGYVRFHQDPLVLCKQDTRRQGADR